MSAIIFDFDGTIADSFEEVLRVFYDMTGRKEALDPAKIERLRGMSLVHAAEEIHVRPWLMPLLIMRGRRRMGRRMEHVHAHKGVPEIIKKLHNEGHQLYIVSSNSSWNIQKFLGRHDLAYEFVNIYGGVGLLNKGRALKKVMKKNRLDKADTWYVGDEVRDIVGAHNAGIPIMSVSWGFNTDEILKAHNPTILIDKPEEIISILEET
jgi:phosphoglycolate phosphatase